MEQLPLVPLRPEVEIPRHRWSAPHSPLVIALALLSLSWLSALTATAVRPTRSHHHRASAHAPVAMHKLRPCRERRDAYAPAAYPMSPSRESRWSAGQ